MTREGFKDRLRTFLFDHPDTWHSRERIARYGGPGGYRARLSQLRLEDGLVIECRERYAKVRGRLVKLTEYQYVSPKRRQKAA